MLKSDSTLRKSPPFHICLFVYVSCQSVFKSKDIDISLWLCCFDLILCVLANKKGKIVFEGLKKMEML